MNTELDKRATLAKIIKNMSDADTQQMLAYAAGYEAGRISQNHSKCSEKKCKHQSRQPR